MLCKMAFPLPVNCHCKAFMSSQCKTVTLKGENMRWTSNDITELKKINTIIANIYLCQWTRMRSKPKKSRSISIIQGELKTTKVCIREDSITSVSKQVEQRELTDRGRVQQIKPGPCCCEARVRTTAPPSTSS